MFTIFNKKKADNTSSTVTQIKDQEKNPQKHNSTEQNNDKKWGEYNKQCIKHIKNGDYGLYRNTLYNMSVLVGKEKRYKDAAALLVHVAYLDISGLGNSVNTVIGDKALYTSIHGSAWFPYSRSIATFPLGEKMMNYKERIGFDDKEFRSFVTEQVNKLSAPFHIFTKDECIDIIVYETYGEKEKVAKIYAKAKKSLKKQYPKSDFGR